MAVTYFQSNKILNALFTGAALNPAGTLYVGLSTNAILSDGTGVIEPSGMAYARVPITATSTNFNSAINGALTTKVDIQFPESTGNWGTVTYVFLADSATLTAGAYNVLFYDVLSPARPVAIATTVLFSAGSVTFQVVNS